MTPKRSLTPVIYGSAADTLARFFLIRFHESIEFAGIAIEQPPNIAVDSEQKKCICCVVNSWHGIYFSQVHCRRAYASVD